MSKPIRIETITSSTIPTNGSYNGMTVNFDIKSAGFDDMIYDIQLAIDTDTQSYSYHDLIYMITISRGDNVIVKNTPLQYKLMGIETYGSANESTLKLNHPIFMNDVKVEVEFNNKDIVIKDVKLIVRKCNQIKKWMRVYYQSKHDRYKIPNGVIGNITYEYTGYIETLNFLLTEDEHIAGDNPSLKLQSLNISLSNKSGTEWLCNFDEHTINSIMNKDHMKHDGTGFYYELPVHAYIDGDFTIEYKAVSENTILHIIPLFNTLDPVNN